MFLWQASQWRPVTRACQTSVEVFTIRPRWASHGTAAHRCAASLCFYWCIIMFGVLICLLLCLLQSFDKQGFHAGTPPPFSLPSALGGPGPLNPGAAPGGYAPAPFLHILPHQQPHSQLLHHHLAQDGQVTLTVWFIVAQILHTRVSHIFLSVFLSVFRVVLASVASPAACSRRAKSTSRATVAPPTGPTEVARATALRARVCARGRTHTCTTPAYLTDKIIEGQTILQHKLKTHTHYHPPCPLCSVYPLFKFMAVVCKIYLCMYLYSIYVLVGHKMWFSELFLFWRTFYFKKMWKRWEC